jgi:hypothetical protein
MRLPIVLATFLVVCSALPLAAQAPPTDAAAPVNDHDVVAILDVGTTEWMATAGPAFGIVIFHSAGGHRYFLPALSWGRILSGPVGPGVLRGRFQWSFEVVPLFGQFAPENTLGLGLTPLLWRWNFEPRGRFAPFAELAGGGLWTRDPVPSRTTTANFTAHAAYGIRYFLRPHAALVASYRLHHISNGNRLERNPGVNAHVLQFGVSVMHPR